LKSRAYMIPAVLAILTVAGVLGASFISVPTLTYVYDEGFSGETQKVVLIVEGVRCRGTAVFLREHMESVPGLVSLVAYAGKHRVVIEYAPQAVKVDEIISAIEKPIVTDDGLMEFFRVTSSAGTGTN